MGIELNDGYRDIIAQRIRERRDAPDWRKLDILHSATMETGMPAPRKSQYRREGASLPLPEEASADG